MQLKLLNPKRIEETLTRFPIFLLKIINFSRLPILTFIKAADWLLLLHSYFIMDAHLIIPMVLHPGGKMRSREQIILSRGTLAHMRHSQYVQGYLFSQSMCWSTFKFWAIIRKIKRRPERGTEKDAVLPK